MCARPGAALCDGCRGALVRLTPPVCDRCGSPGAWPVARCAECTGRRLAFTRARAAVVYDTTARSIVRVWKERGREPLAVEAARLVAEVIPRPAVQALVPVPGDPERALERGRVPQNALARALGVRWQLPVTHCLRRLRALPRQRGLRLVDRTRNVRGSVGVTGDVPDTVCVVDDVYTSGATVNACAAALRRAGARHVEVVTFSRAVR